MVRRSIPLGAVVIALVATLALAASVFAGGFAIANLDSGGPPQPVAGQGTRLGFTVLQHGRTPWTQGGVSVVARNQATGQTIRADAIAEGQDGHYVATLTFPAAGTWDWDIEMPLLMQSKFPPLTVLPVGSAPVAAPAHQPAEAPVSTPAVPVMGLVALAAILAGAGYLLLRRRPTPAVS
jgi:hypothetical protein